MPAINRSRSLSPSLLSNAPHRYIPYRKINSSYTFGVTQPVAAPSVSVSGSGSMRSSPETYACKELGKLNLSEHVTSHQTQRRVMDHGNGHPTRRTIPSHRRAVSLSSIQHTQAYILIPPPPPQPYAYPHFQVQGTPVGVQTAPRRTRVPHPLINVNRHPSPSLTPIVESPLPIIPTTTVRTPSPAQTEQIPPTALHLANPYAHHVQHRTQHKRHQRTHQHLHQHQQLQQKQLMLVTPTLAAYLKKGGSVNVKAADGKSWKIRAPQMSIPTSIVSPTCGMRMMRMQ